MISWFKRRQDQQSVGAGFPPLWVEILVQRFPLYQRLCEADRRELESHIHRFLRQKRFEGCAGMVITDEIRVTVAAQACLLLLHRPTGCYQQLSSILVYPSTYFAPTLRPVHGGVVSEEHSARLGESWQHGAVVLAWDSVRDGAANSFDGQNVVFHEFAHQLDQEDGRADGAPILGKGKSLQQRVTTYASWARVLAGEYEQLRRKTDEGRETLLDEYGGSDPAEFFAVATECFFEKPKQLLKKHPQLYAELKGFYCQDPAGWAEETANTADPTAGAKEREPINPGV